MKKMGRVINRERERERERERKRQTKRHRLRGRIFFLTDCVDLAN